MVKFDKFVKKKLLLFVCLSDKQMFMLLMLRPRLIVAQDVVLYIWSYSRKNSRIEKKV